MSISRGAFAALLFAFSFPSIASAAYVCGTNRQGDYFLSLRTCPSTRCEELARLVEGRRMSIIRQEGNWYYVAAGDQVGYVSGRYVCD